jgi:hypothetical protein
VRHLLGPLTDIDKHRRKKGGIAAQTQNRGSNKTDTSFKLDTRRIAAAPKRPTLRERVGRWCKSLITAA